MTYRIAYVKFTKSGGLYPVNCDRSDLDPGDLVVVKMSGSELHLKVAMFERQEYLNWDCKHSILCKRDEIKPDGDGGYQVCRVSQPRHLETFGDLERELFGLGWRQTGFSRHIYKWVHLKRFEEAWVAVGLRKNGIDFQIFVEGWGGEKSRGPQTFPEGTRNLVRHYFYDSKTDLLEFTKNFALNAHLPLPQLAEFFIPMGERVRPKDISERDPMADIRAALGDAMTDTERAAFG